MDFRLLPLLACTTFFTGITGISAAQILLRGMVVDSSSVEALPDVNLLNKATGRVVVTDFRGSFTLEASETDTIVFSRVGYYSKVIPAARVHEVVIIFLKEELRMLKAVEINAKDGPLSFPLLPGESAWKNPNYNRSFTETPGFQGVQTFGPGYIFKMPGSGFKKEARQKEKLSQVKEENSHARDYIHLVNSPEIKGRIMKDFQLTEMAYYEVLARFNEKNKDIIYRLAGHEVIPLLIQFYADNAKQK